MSFWSRQSSSGLWSHVSGTARARQRQTRKLAALEHLESREMLTAFLVTSTDDSTDPGTLRWAMQSANESTGADTIAFDSSFDSSQTITIFAGQLPTLTETTTISGPGADVLTIDGLGTYRVFQVADGAIVSITGVTIANGFASQSEGDYDAGQGGGILNYGQLTLLDVTMIGNQGDYYGGAIYNSGLLNISDSTITQSWSLNGGGIYNQGLFIANHVELANNSSLYIGGAIHSEGTSSISYCVIEGNTSSEYGSGGGISQGSSETAVMTISYSTIANNSAGNLGGGLYNLGQLTITSSTVSGNTAYDGGGVYDAGRLRLANSTVAGNSAERGGGLKSNGLLEISNSTISGNSATERGGGIYIDSALPPPTLASTIVFGNLGNGVADNIAGLIEVNTSVGNLFGPGSEGFWVPNFNSNRNLFFEAGTDIGLGPLGDNGGVTQTMPLLANSPAIDAGYRFVRPGPSSENDQRGDGFARLQGVIQDIGAFESSFVHGSEFVNEGTSYVTRIHTFEPHNNPLNFSLTGGEDQDLFSIDSETGVLAFTSPPDYESPLDANSDNLYQVQVTVTDADGQTFVQPWTIRVEDSFEYHVVIFNSQPAVYQIGGAPLQDSTAEFYAAADDLNYAGAKLVVSISENRDVKDLLKIVPQGNAAGQISIKRKNVLFGGVIIGTVQGGAKTSPNLVVTFNAAASEAAVSALVKQVGFSTKNKRVPQSPRTIKMQVIDLPGGEGVANWRQFSVIGRS